MSSDATTHYRLQAPSARRMDQDESLAKTYRPDFNPRKPLEELFVPLEEWFTQTHLSLNRLQSDNSDYIPDRMLIPKPLLCIGYPKPLLRIEYPMPRSKWHLQPREILQLICLSLSPVDQYNARKALHLTCRAFATKIKPFRADFMTMSYKNRAIYLLEIGFDPDYLLTHHMTDKRSLSEIIIRARKLELLTDHMCFSSAAVEAAISTGQVEFLRWYHQIGRIMPCYFYPHRNVCDCAASYGQLDSLRFLHLIGTPIDNHTVEKAVEHGHTNCLRYLHEAGVSISMGMPLMATRAGHADCLRFLGDIGMVIDDNLAKIAAEEGKLSCLQYIYEKNGSLGRKICRVAASNGQLECLKFARQCGAYWDEDTCRYAARHGHFECLVWAHQNGCKLDLTTGISPSYFNICQCAADAGSLECLRYCHENGIGLNMYVKRSAKQSHNIECILYVKAHWKKR